MAPWMKAAPTGLLQNPRVHRRADSLAHHQRQAHPSRNISRRPARITGGFRVQWDPEVAFFIWEKYVGGVETRLVGAALRIYLCLHRVIEQRAPAIFCGAYLVCS